MYVWVLPLSYAGYICQDTASCKFAGNQLIAARYVCIFYLEILLKFYGTKAVNFKTSWEAKLRNS